MSQYENMKFEDYEHREYPKFIQTGEKLDPLTKTMVATGVRVESLAEEEAITRPKQPPQPVADPEPIAKIHEPASGAVAGSELDRLRDEYTKAKGEAPDKRWGVGKLQHVLSNADAADDSDPDA